MTRIERDGIFMDDSTQFNGLHVWRSLLIKDWRQARLPVMELLIIGVSCYLLPVLADWNSVHRETELFDLLFKGAISGLYVTALTAAAVAGIAIAGERSDRTAEFVAMLPVSRTQICLSKWAVAVVVLGSSAMFHAAAALAIETHDVTHHIKSSLTHELSRDQAINYSLVWFGVILSLFGVAWFLGSFLRSAVISTCVSIGVTLGSILALTIYFDSRGPLGESGFQGVQLLTASMGVAGLIGGTVVYLRRVRP